MTQTLLAPAPSSKFVAQSGTSYSSDGYNIVSGVANTDVVSLLNQGCRYANNGKDNLSATTNPGVSNDSTQDYSQGSLWYNTTSDIVWRCISAAASAAVWVADAENYYLRKVGTFTANGATGVDVTDAAYAITDLVVVSLNTAGGTVGAIPHLSSATAASTKMQFVGTASDTSVYNYAVWSKIN